MLATRGELPVAIGLLETVLAAGGPGRSLRSRRALAGIAALCGEYRSAPALLAPLLVPLVTDEDGVVSGNAIAQLDSLGPQGRCGVDAALTVASRPGGDGELADAALTLLIALGEPRAVPLLARDLASRRDALEAAAGKSWRGSEPAVSFDPALLQAARDLIRNPDRRNYAAPRHLCALLGSWGAKAAAALPGQAADLLKELGGGALAPRVADRFRELLADDRRPPARTFDFHRIHNDQNRVAAIQAALQG